MANNKIFTILLFLLFIGFDLHATEPNKLGEGVFSALQQTIDQNESNRVAGIKDRSFLISVDASNPSVFVAECPNPQIGFINEYESSNELVEVWENLDTKLCDFNSQNIWNMNHYGIALFFPLNSEDSELDPILNDFINLSDQDNIVSYLTNEVNGQKRKSFGSLYSNIQEMLDEDLRLPMAGGEMMVTITSIFPIDTYNGEIEFITVTNTVFVHSPSMDQNFAPFIEFVDTNNTYLDVSATELNHYENFYRRLFGYTYYFENIDGLPNNSECSSLENFNFSNNSVKQAKYQQIISCYCDHYTGDLTLDEEELEFLFTLMNFKKTMFALTLDEWVCEPDLASEAWTNWESGVLPDFVNNHGTQGWKDYLVDKITSSQSTDPYIVQYIMLYFNSTTFADHAQLTATQRYDLISRIVEDVDPNDPAIQIFQYDPLDIVYTLLKSLYDFDSGDIDEFYPYIKDNKIFFDWYWNKAFINFTGNLARKKEFCNVLTDIALSQFAPPNGEGSFIEQFENKGKLFTWKIFDGTPICGYHTYYDANYNDDSHKAEFKYKFIADVSAPSPVGYYNPVANIGAGYDVITPTWSDPFPVSLHPFELVAVVSGEHAKWTSDCGSLISPNCEFQMRLIPAFVLSFYIAEAQSSENWEQFLSGVQVVSIFASAYAMATATTVSAAVFYGAVLLADIGVLVVPPTYASAIQDEYDVNEINIRVQRVENVVNIASGVLGAADLLKAIKAVSAYLHLRNLGTGDLEQMNKALLMIKHSSQIDASDPAKICDLFQLSPHARSIIMQLDDQPSHVKILLASWIDMKPALGNSARSLNDYKFLAKTFFDAELTKAVLKMDEVKFLKFLDDFEDFTPFLTDTKLISRWTVLYGDGSDIYKPYRTNMNNLSKVDDYLNHNPSKKNALADEFLNTANKDNFISSFIDGPLRKNELEDLNGYYYKEAISYDDGNGIPLTELEMLKLEELEVQLGSYQHSNTINVNSNQIIVETSNGPQQPPFHFWADVKVQDGKIEGLVPNKTYDYVITYNSDGSPSELRFGLGHYITSGSSNAVVGAGTVKFDEFGKIYYLSRKTGHYKSQPLAKLPQELDETVNILSENNLIADNFVPDYTYN